ncbi:MAG TPA: TIGR00159 family protein [Candidatus Egerieimonas intestinavium]|uniref:Diadenylate cyclase n=1 Tax=Candidatus Egerieimonas intestinavium TaxID=2840777 RepID=A0A9D1EKM8_9FIRM|nr:TIGR00159 family protein [Candidatus Egerieimonas intestinavium]
MKQIIMEVFQSISWPKNVEIMDFIQILLIAFFVYHLMLWIKNTRAYTLLKGIVFVGVILLGAQIFEMHTILWIFQNLSMVAVTGILVIFQPELRKALEQLGEKNVISTIIPFDSSREVEGVISDRSINELVRATYDMAEVKTGALIVLERMILLQEYEKTGIILDSEISSQLLINIFEHNTPLHDGAVMIRNNRLVAATCYLPLSENMDLNKNLGTRHRAAVGISEVSDALTIVVSEETGKVSYTLGGAIHTNVPPSDLREQLHRMQKKVEKSENGKFRIWRGKVREDEKTQKTPDK